jgi:hypothetical protein
VDFLLSNLGTLFAVAKYFVPASFTGALVAWATWFAGLFQPAAPASWIIAGVLGALAGSLIVYLAVVARERLQIVRLRNATLFSSHINPLDTLFTTRRVRITDLAPPVGQVIDGKTFVDCDILGPANVMFQGCHFHHNTGEVVDALIVKLGASPTNGFGFRNCIFRQCRFYLVTFMVEERDYEQFNGGAHAGLNWITNRPDAPVILPPDEITAEPKSISATSP